MMSSVSETTANELSVETSAKKYRLVGAMGFVVIFIIVLLVLMKVVNKRDVDISTPSQKDQSGVYKTPDASMNASVAPEVPAVKIPASPPVTSTLPQSEVKTDTIAPATLSVTPELPPIKQEILHKKNPESTITPKPILSSPSWSKHGKQHTKANTQKFFIKVGTFNFSNEVEKTLKEYHIHYDKTALKHPVGAVRIRTGAFTNKAAAESALARLKLAGLVNVTLVKD